MQEIKLKAQKRDLIGRKVKQLRTKGIIPANVYGKKIKSQSISLNKDEFGKVYSEAGETGIVKLSIEGEKEVRPILIQNLQKDPVTEEPLHIDLRQIILTEKIIARIPVELSGSAPAAQQKLGILIQTTSEIEVEALPLDLPEKFIVDVSKLSSVGDQITVKEIEIDRKKVELKVTEDLVVAKIEPLAEEEVAPAPTAPIEGETVAEGTTPVAEEGEKTDGGETSKEDKSEIKEEKK